MLQIAIHKVCGPRTDSLNSELIPNRLRPKRCRQGKTRRSSIVATDSQREFIHSRRIRYTSCGPSSRRTGYASSPGIPRQPLPSTNVSPQRTIAFGIITRRTSPNMTWNASIRVNTRRYAAVYSGSARNIRSEFPFSASQTGFLVLHGP
jgi:hypothetical protein